MRPPSLPRAHLDSWRRVDETTERPFDSGPVSVEAHTVRYERNGPEPRPFVFTSRLHIRPETAPNAALTRLVQRQAKRGFRDRLAERDIGAVEHRGDREIALDDPTASRATLSTFRGQCANPDGADASTDSGLADPVPVEALLAVWSADGYLLAGGAYPLDDGAYPPDRDAADARRDLLRIIRGATPRDPAE
ncbi:hypothetical protein [Halorubrum laminariae]|uniref:Uncharacterized protein n=1 Tax=Halorubrum laminariae TaxID=1433523 RepID=A0ABD6C4A6_9EURY|nr:hypothetical protein [Halorubrum laminariae]